jgi:branched-chain amino acid transport system ATP-binding protein
LLLEARGIGVFYGHVKAIEDVSFHAAEGEIVAMIGPNGAGKSTALKAVFGLVPLRSGDVLFGGKNLAGLRPDERVPLGISCVPEGRRLFPSMTVIENLEMGAFSRSGSDTKEEVERIFGLLPALEKRAKLKAGALSTGEQQMVAMGRALTQRPRLLLADEPSLGMSPAYVDVIFELLANINKAGVAILLVEQNARMALEIAHRGYVFRIGGVHMEGSGKSLLGNREVERTFLGG